VQRTLLAVPNVSEGRSRHAIDAIGAAFGSPLLNVHADADHHRSVFTLAGAPGTLARRVTDGAAAALDQVRIDQHTGIHPRVGAIDVAPIVYRSEVDRGAACAEALVLADLLGDELQLPVFLYGILADGRTPRAARCSSLPVRPWWRSTSSSRRRPPSRTPRKSPH
jgi:glutamate formiminotransferase